MPYCSFCGRDHRRKRGEHVIPKWITREFPDVDWTITNLLTNYVRKGERYIPILTPVPCARCDNEWMSDLEKLVKPILLPLLYGKPSTLTMLDQKLLATWFFKTAVMYDLHAAESVLRPRYFEDAEHQQLKRSRSFPPAYRFYIGRYLGEYEGLFAKNGQALRGAELFGHEGSHGVFALDNIAEAVKLQMLLNDRDAALRNMPKGTKYPYPPDVMQKMEAAE